MATKADFTPEEWKQISVMMAGMAVTLADPSGLIRLTKEGMASGSALVAVKSDPNANALVKAAVADFETSEGRSAARECIKTTVSDKQTAEMKDALLTALARVGAILDTKASAEASAFKLGLCRFPSVSPKRPAKAAFLALVACE